MVVFCRNCHFLSAMPCSVIFSGRGRRPPKVLPNGTSDGDDHSTQDSDSMRSNPGQQQDLTRALELQPMVDSSFSMGDADDDKLNVCVMCLFLSQIESTVFQYLWHKQRLVFTGLVVKYFTVYWLGISVICMLSR